MTRINSAIAPKHLTDEHLLAEHREIKRLPYCLNKAISSGSIKHIPKTFVLGRGHVTFFLDKMGFISKRYDDIRKECIRRGFLVEDYSENFNNIGQLYCKSYVPTKEEKELLIYRISDRLENTTKPYWHYYGQKVDKNKAIDILTDDYILD